MASLPRLYAAVIIMLVLALLLLSLVGVATAASTTTTLVGRLAEFLMGLGVLLTAASVSREMVRARG